MPPNNIQFQATKLRHWLSPLIHLSNNWISLLGVVLVTTAAILWIFLLPTFMRGEPENPYIGILTFLILPGVFFAGLALIPAGLYLKYRREKSKGIYPDTFEALGLRNVDLRRLVAFLAVTTVANLIIGSHLTYKAVTYMDSVTFCGLTCHSVMKPEFTAYQNSPHSRVECVRCHIGPGASWFVKAKISGLRQVYAVTFNTHSRPIPTPVHDLRPARETCEACHWPQKFGGDRLRIIDTFADDEQNSKTKTVLLMRIGGGTEGPARDSGIHGAHLGPGITISYLHSDESRQSIPRVEYENLNSGRRTTYIAEGVKPETFANMPSRVMDCMDCHNRPSHTFEIPERAVNRAMEDGTISPSLPFARKTAVELLKKTYTSEAEASVAIPREFQAFYQANYAKMSAVEREQVRRSGQAVLGIWKRNIFPEMNVTWGSYPNNIGHTDFPGCFRCHDDGHKSADNRTITQDCNTCHVLLGMDEPAPKILTDLGLVAEAK